MVENETQIGFTITGGVSSGTLDTSGQDNLLSGFTCGLTTFQFTASSELPGTIYNDKFIWNLGDGTVVKGISAEHIYSFPGIYNISVVGYNTTGIEYLSTQTKQVSVTDFFDTKLIHDNISIFGVVQLRAGRL